jgi:predicted ribosome quality control (RQC) complex YloA/Tae2 family protein
VQLTGRSANLFLLDDDKKIAATAGKTRGDGQQIRERYSPPQRRSADAPVPLAAKDEHSLASETGDADKSVQASISEQLDAEYLERKAERDFQTLAGNARLKITSEIKRKEKLQKNLTNDLKDHGDAARWKHFGDVLLANTATAKRKDGAFLVTDYFDVEQKTIEIPFENEDSLPETAEKYFRRYTKARNAADEIAKRLAETEKELDKLRERLAEVEEHIAERNIAALTERGSPRPISRSGFKKRTGASAVRSGYRTFISSDGFEILVGKKAKDNDTLTQRVAKSLDTWMHAADYPGSHVVIRDSGKREVPNQTLLEAAQLAAFYSQGRKQVKAAVHYTQKKFVNKPKGSAPGLVSLASFKTLLVEPKVPKGVRSV